VESPAYSEFGHQTSEFNPKSYNEVQKKIVRKRGIGNSTLLKDERVGDIEKWSVGRLFPWYSACTPRTLLMIAG